MGKSKQSLGSILSAELKRTVLKPKRIVFALAFAVIAVLVFAGQLAVTDWASGQIQEIDSSVDMSGFNSLLGFALPTSILSLCFGLYAASFSARDYNDGTIMATLVAVPRRSALFFARLFPWILITLVASIIAIALSAVIGYGRMGSLDMVAAKGALSVVSVVCAAICGFCCGSVSKKGSLAVFFFLGLWILIPMAMGAVGGMGPEILQKAASWIDLAMPGTAFAFLPELVGEAVSDSGNIIAGTVATAVWTIGFPIVANILFAKRATLGK